MKQKPKFFITLANFSTFIDRQYANISGLRMGLVYDKRIRFGLGIFNLTNNAVVSKVNIKENGLDYITNGQLYLSFASISAEYFIYNEYPWQCGVMPVQLGFGSAKYGYINRPYHLKTYTGSEALILYQPEISTQYNVFRWIGVGASTGYRFTILRSHKATQGLNAVMFAFDIRLFLDEIYKIVVDKQ